MNYDEMCDEEIEVRVAYHEYDGVLIPLYCSSPADAWPIIVENRIDFEWLGVSVEASDITGKFDAIDKDNNALRACMICYLKMMEAKA